MLLFRCKVIKVMIVCFFIGYLIISTVFSTQFLFIIGKIK